MLRFTGNSTSVAADAFSIINSESIVDHSPASITAVAKPHIESFLRLYFGVHHKMGLGALAPLIDMWQVETESSESTPIET